MAEKTSHNYATHTRFDPPFHFFIVPVVLISVLLRIWSLFQGPINFTSIWAVVVGIAATNVV